MQTPINLIKGDKVRTDTEYGDFLPVNMTAVIKPILGASGYMLQYEGLELFGNLTGVCRGGLWNEKFFSQYRVSGNDFIEVDENGVTTVIGTISGANVVSMPYSFTTQGIVADGKFWRYDPVNGLVQFTGPNIGAPIDAVWVDGVYFFTDGNYLYHTDFSNESMISPLQFATAEFMPDKSLGLGKTQDNKVIVFGRYTTEYFVNQAIDNFAFRRIDARAVKIGIVGTHCKVEIDNNWYLLGGRKQENVGVHVLGVGSAVKISTRQIEKILATYNENELSEVTLDTYKKDEYTYLVINLPNETLLFNKTFAEKLGIEQAWTILKSAVTGNQTFRGIFYVFDPRNGKWILGDKLNSNMGMLSEAVTTHYGELVEWVLTTPFMNLERQSIDELEIETIPGFTGSPDATVFLSLTYNGLVYGTEYIQLYGLPYEYGQRFIVRRLGYVPSWVGMKLRGASLSRMAFGKGFINHG